MNKVNYINISELAEEILYTYYDNMDDSEISVFINVEDAAILLRELIGQDYTLEDVLSVESLNIDSFEDDVILITIDENGGIWAENAEGKDRFKIVESGIIFTDPLYYEDVKLSNGTDDIEYTIFTVGEQADNGPKKVMIATNDDGRISGFKYEDNQDGHCFSVEYCSCDPIEDVKKMLEVCNNILEEYGKMIQG